MGNFGIQALDGFGSELNFLTFVPMMNNKNRDTIWNQLQGGFKVDGFDDGTSTFKYAEASSAQENPKRVVMFKGRKDGDIVNYYKDKIYTEKVQDNPYVDLLTKFNAEKSEGNEGFQAVNLTPPDFAYLTNLGVYPLNRLWILRRYAEGQVVPNNLLDWENAPYPISTVIGWVPPEETNFFGVDFSEDWITTNDRIDQVLMKILEKEFGIKGASAVSIPGWSQGLLMGFLGKMGISNFDSTNIPFGNPNVLQEAATRVTDPTKATYGLKSTMSVKLKTSYEQKFIGDIDPGSAMQDLIRNLTRMGTSDVLYFSPADAKIFTDLRAAAGVGSDATLWWEFIKTLINHFLAAIEELFGVLEGALGTNETANNAVDPNDGSATNDVVDEVLVDEVVEDKGKSSIFSFFGGGEDEVVVEDEVVEDKPVNKTQEQLNQEAEQSGKEKAQKTLKSGKDALNTVTGSLKTLMNGALASILASTVGKWKWPLKGGLGVMTGENTTPWHLTLGNPHSPFVSQGNIKVSKVAVSFNNEMGYNDIPTRMDVEISVEFGRNLGGQEIFAMFNNGYTRVYDTKNGQISLADMQKSKKTDTKDSKDEESSA